MQEMGAGGPARGVCCGLRVSFWLSSGKSDDSVEGSGYPSDLYVAVESESSFYSSRSS